MALNDIQHPTSSRQSHAILQFLPFFTSIIALLSLLSGSAFASRNNGLQHGPKWDTIDQHHHGFKTEPDFWPENFHVKQIPKNRSVLAPGYIIMNSFVESKYGFGQYIFTEEGDLVWAGNLKRKTQNIHICDYLGEKGNHICYYTRHGSHKIPKLPEAEQFGHPTTTYGHLVILDNTYKVVNEYKHGFDKLSVNGHAFETWNNGTRLTTIVGRPRNVDLSEQKGPKHCWIANQCIQEMDIVTGKDTFHWCYYESGLSLWETVRFGRSAKTGNLAQGVGIFDSHWDFMHMNAVAKTSEGDFLSSSRHLDQIIKVAGPDSVSGKKAGTVMWRLGGRHSDFKFVNYRKYQLPQGFTKQHDVQSLWSNGTKERISLFNNAWDGATPSSQPFSDGQIIDLDTETMEATLVEHFPHPYHNQKNRKKLSQGRGNVQKLPNGNTFVAWGWLPHFTEYDSDGNIIYHVEYTRKKSKRRPFSYRIFRQPWVGKPYYPPKLLAYCGSCTNSPMVAYASWNGATEVTQWRFYTSSHEHGPWIPAGTFDKKGFETKAFLQDTISGTEFARYVSVEALDKEGETLGSAIEQTFVPKDKFSKKCDNDGCPFQFKYINSRSKAWKCVDRGPAEYIVFFVLIIFIEGTMWVWRRLFTFEDYSDQQGGYEAAWKEFGDQKSGADQSQRSSEEASGSNEKDAILHPEELEKGRHSEQSASSGYEGKR